MGTKKQQIARSASLVGATLTGVSKRLGLSNTRNFPLLLEPLKHLGYRIHRNFAISARI
jgi:hypothetical protein